MSLNMRKLLALLALFCVISTVKAEQLNGGFVKNVTMGLIALTTWLFEADSFTKWMIILYSISMIMNSFGVIRNYFTSLVWNEYIVKTEISRTLIGAGIKVILLLLHAPLVCCPRC